MSDQIDPVEPREGEVVSHRRVISWKPFFDALHDAGLLPEPGRTSRVVIDASVGKPCTLTSYTFLDESFLDEGGVMRHIREADSTDDALAL